VVGRQARQQRRGGKRWYGGNRDSGEAMAEEQRSACRAATRGATGGCSSSCLCGMNLYLACVRGRVYRRMECMAVLCLYASDMDTSTGMAVSRGNSTGVLRIAACTLTYLSPSPSLSCYLVYSSVYLFLLYSRAALVDDYRLISLLSSIFYHLFLLYGRFRRFARLYALPSVL